MTNLEYLLPFLQATSTFHKTMQGFEKTSNPLKTKLRFVDAALTGIAEAISCISLSLFYKLSSSQEDVKKRHYYILLSRGAWAGLVLSIAGIWDHTFAATLPAKIEELCDHHWDALIKSSQRDVKIRLQIERKDIFDSLRDEDFTTRTRVLAKWDKRNKQLEEKVKKYVAKQKNLYPSLKMHEKYPFLHNLKTVIATVR